MSTKTSTLQPSQPQLLKTNMDSYSCITGIQKNRAIRIIYILEQVYNIVHNQQLVSQAIIYQYHKATHIYRQDSSQV